MNSRSLLFAIGCAGLTLAAWSGFAPAHAKDRLPKLQWKDSSQVHAAFRTVVSHINPSVVAVLVDGRQVSLGTIITPDGLILTKASELGDHIRCRLRDGREFDAVNAGEHDRYDVALVKIDAEDLPAIEWADGRDPKVGQWLATPGMDADPVAVGIVSVARRPIPPEKGVLGVQLSDGVPGPRVTHVVPSSAAARAGLQTGDLILRAGDQSVADSSSFDRLLHKLAPGDTVNVVVLRDNHQLTLRAVLGRSIVNTTTRGYMMNRMSGRMSQRRAGFPQAIQHDTVLDPETCGGPVVDLSGRPIGINIARAGRVETFAVPADVVKSLIREIRAEEADLAAKAARPHAAEGVQPVKTSEAADSSPRPPKASSKPARK